MPQTLRRRGRDPLPTGTRNGSRPRPARGIVATAVCLLALATAPAAAVTATVPDDFPTIQEAMGEGADTVYVRYGTYSESPVIFRTVALIGLPEGDDLPTLAGLTIAPPAQPDIGTPMYSVGSLRFESQVVIDNSESYSFITFEACHFLGGIGDYSAYPATGRLILSRCHVDAASFLNADGDCFVDSCAFAGGLEAGDGNCNLIVNGSLFRGNGTGFGLSTNGGGGSDVKSATITNTLIQGFSTGFAMSAVHNIRLDSVVVRDCRANGVYAYAERVSIIRSSVDGCGDYGISAVGSESLLVVGNVITHSRTWGLLADPGFYGEVRNNVVSRNGSEGIWIGDYVISDLKVMNNSSCLNGGSGFLIEATAGGRFDLVGNVGYGNAAYGSRWGVPDVAMARCNDWFANGAGSVQGALLSDEDLSLDPLFCDVGQGDVHLSAGSPLLNATGCGLIGALSQGCDAPMACRLTTFTAVSATDGVEVRWHVADAAPGFVAWIERAEASTGPWAKVECERESDGEVTVEYDRSTAPARAYWYRLVATDRGVTRVLGEPIQVETAPPTRFALLGTGPNPSPGVVVATFQLAHAADITLEVFDAQGRRVATLARGSWPAGIHRANWVGARPASGVYLVRYRHPGGEDLRRIAIVR